jgi:HAD superfamily hydrolase (TIGR01509 family)
MAPRTTAGVVLVDVDGTLVDSNYQNALAWYRAFRQVDLTVPVWQIHRHMGMGGDQLVAAVTDEDTERRLGDRLRTLWSEAFAPMLAEVAPLPGATELLRACVRRRLQVVLASSGAPEHVEHYLDLLGARSLVHAWTTSDDVERTKPDPTLLDVAMGRSDGGPAVMVGDSPWDVEAARRAGIPAVAVLGGGYGRSELEEARPIAVVSSLNELEQRLDLLGPGARA